MAEGIEDNCGGCKYYRPNQNNLRQGTCRRFPPQLTILAMPKGPIPAADFPLTVGTSWCGEFQAKVVLAS